MRVRLAVLLSALILAVIFAGCSSANRQFAHAARLEHNNQPAQALTEYQALLARIPPNQMQAISQLQMRIGECQWRLGRGTEAFAAFKKAAEADSGNRVAQLRLAELYLAGGAPERAQEHARTVLNRDPHNPDALAVMGAAYQAGNDPVSAKRAYAEALKSDPSRTTIAIALADISEQENRPAEGRQVLRRAAEAAPQDPAPLLALGRLEEEEGNNRAAEDNYRAAVRCQDTVETNLRLAQFLERSARVPEAEAVLRRSDHLGSSQPTALADFEMISGRAFLALRHYLDVLHGAAIPGDPAALAPPIAPPSRAAIAGRLIEADLESPHGTGTVAVKSAPTAVERARQHLQEFRADLDPVTTAILEAEIALAGDNLALATTRATAAVAESPQSAAAHYVLGISKFGAGDVGAAKTEWLAAIEADPSFLPARLALGRQALAAGNIEAAEEQALAVVREEPGNLRGLLLYARILAAKGEYDSAVIIGKRALAVTQANPEPHIVLGEIALQRKNVAEALTHYEQAVIIAPNSPEAMDGLARVYRCGHVTREMLAHMEAIGQQPPRSAAILELVGRLYADHGWYEDTIRALSASLAVEPQRSTAAVVLARTYARTGQLQAAEDSAVRAGNRTAVLLRAARAQRNQDFKAAIADYEAAISGGDHSGVAANNLAWIYADRGENLNRALALAEAARAKGPRNPAFLDTLGFVHLRRREYSEAVDTLTKAEQLAALTGGPPHPALPEIRQHLAEAYRLAGQPDAARAVAGKP